MEKIRSANLLPYRNPGVNPNVLDKIISEIRIKKINKILGDVVGKC